MKSAVSTTSPSFVRGGWAVVAAAVAACVGGEGSTGVSTPQVATVEITPAADTLKALDATRQLTAIGKDAVGNTISGKTFTWSSSAPSVVSVDAAMGIVTAVANGVATISATVDGAGRYAALSYPLQRCTVVHTLVDGLRVGSGQGRRQPPEARR